MRTIIVSEMTLEEKQKYIITKKLKDVDGFEWGGSYPIVNDELLITDIWDEKTDEPIIFDYHYELEFDDEIEAYRDRSDSKITKV